MAKHTHGVTATPLGLLCGKHEWRSDRARMKNVLHGRSQQFAFPQTQSWTSHARARWIAISQTLRYHAVSHLVIGLALHAYRIGTTVSSPDSHNVDGPLGAVGDIRRQPRTEVSVTRKPNDAFRWCKTSARPGFG